MKNKRKVLAPTIAGLATCSMVLPLALSATSCSCSKFASTSVLDGDYVPDFEPYDAGVDEEGNYNFVNIPQGEDLMLKAYINDKKMPAKEHKWMASGAAYYLTYAADRLNNQLGYEAIKINKYNADLKNFKVEDQRTGRVSYDISQDIDVTLDVQPGNIPFPSNLKLDSIAGNIRLAWNHKVKNMPLGIFDLGTDSWNIFGTQKIQKRLAPYGDKPFTDMTIWFVAPDMSEVPAGDKTWALDLDFLIDANIDVNGDKLIDIDHEYTFTFDKYAAWGVEELVKAFADSDQEAAKIMGLAYIFERFIPLCSGWMSYYLSQCHHMDHIISYDPAVPAEMLGWQTPYTYTLDPEVIHDAEIKTKLEADPKKNPTLPTKPIHRQHIYAYTKSNQEANIVYELADNTYTDNDIFAACIGVNTDGGNFSIASLLKSLMKGQFPFSVPRGINTTSEVSAFGKTISLKFDWSKKDLNRPSFGESSKSLLGYDYLLPIVMTKDWVAAGDPFTLIEGGHIWDMYENHQKEPYGTEIISTNGELGQMLSFAIDKQTYDILQNEPSRISIELVQDTTGAGAHDLTEIDLTKMNMAPQDNGLGYVLNLPVQIDAEEWGDDISVSHSFHIKAIYDGDVIETAPFILAKQGQKPVGGMRWNPVLSTAIPLDMDEHARGTETKGCIIFPDVKQASYTVVPGDGSSWPEGIAGVRLTFDGDGEKFNPNGTLVMVYKTVGVAPQAPISLGGIKVLDSAEKPVGLIPDVQWIDATPTGSALIGWTDQGSEQYQDGFIGIPPTYTIDDEDRLKSLSSILWIFDKNLANHEGKFSEGVYDCHIYDKNTQEEFPDLEVTLQNTIKFSWEDEIKNEGGIAIVTMPEYLDLDLVWHNAFIRWLSDHGRQREFYIEVSWNDDKGEAHKEIIDKTYEGNPLTFTLLEQ